METISTSNNMQVVKDMIRIHGDNVARGSDPNATTLNPTMVSSVIGSEGLTTTTLVIDRPSNPLKSKEYIVEIPRLDNANTYTEVLTSVHNLLVASDDTQKSKLVSAVDDMFAQAKLLETSKDSAIKRAFLNKLSVVGDVVTTVTSGVTDLRLDADKEIVGSIGSINSKLKSLFSLNQQMLTSLVPVKLYDQRDSLIRDIASSFDIKAIFSASGSVMLQSGSQVLVDSNSYKQLSYKGIGTAAAILGGIDYKPITLHHIDSKHIEQSTSVFMGATGDPIIHFSGGKWGALIDLRDNLLPDISGAVKAFAENVSVKLNELHNNGSTFPPKTSFTSLQEYAPSGSQKWGEEFTIYAVSPEGDPLVSGAGVLLPITIDIANRMTSGNFPPTMSDLIDELNEKLGAAPSRERAAIGAITDDNDVQLDGQYLVNNIQLLPRGTILGGNFSFELDLQGNSHFGSNVEVLEVLVDGVPMALNELPSFRLEKDTNTNTNQGISVAGVVDGSDITLRIRVTGDNGKVNEGVVDFNIPVSDDVELNQRIAYTRDAGAGIGSIGGDFKNNENDGILSHSPIARAKLVDANGVEVGQGQQGRLMIETSSDDYRLVIQGGGFGAQFAFNDLLNFDARTGSLGVNPEILADSNQLAIGRVVSDVGSDVPHTVGTVSASAELAFAGGAFQDAEVFTIAGVDFNFLNAPVDARTDIDTASVTPLQDLVDLINTHPEIKGLVEANFIGTTITITAKALGTNANTDGLGAGIIIDYNFAAATVDLNAAGAAGVPALNTGLIDGEDGIEVSKVFHYSMKANNSQILEGLSSLQTELVDIAGSGLLSSTTTSLSRLATTVTSIITNLLSSAQVKSNVAAAVFQQIDDFLKGNYGINVESEILQVVELSQLLSALAYLLNMQLNSETKTQQIIFG